MGLRITAAIPLFASIVSIALSIVILVSGTNTSNADGNYWLAVSDRWGTTPDGEETQSKSK